jgi:ADP-ribose pyrophosphatase YjhB (NUDIX family)
MRAVRDTFCSYCGAKYPEPLAYPRTCTSCAITVWANPIPVSVVLLPVADCGTPALLVVRRAIEPQIGKLGLPGGFLEEHESFQQGGAREVHEETGAIIDPTGLEPFWFSSSEPKPDRVLLFSVAREIPLSALPAFHQDSETSERGVVLGPGGLEDVFAFPTHVEAAKRYFKLRGVTGNHAFRPA